MFLGYRLKMLRKENGLSQIDLGELIGVSKVSISNYENGTRTPSLEILLMIMNVFNVSADYLLGRELNAVFENNENLTIILSTDDVRIIREIKHRSKLYEKIVEDPKRFFDGIDKNNI